MSRAVGSVRHDFAQESPQGTPKRILGCAVDESALQPAQAGCTDMLSLVCLWFVAVVLLLSLLCLWLLPLCCRCCHFRLVAVVVAIVFVGSVLSLLIFPSFVVASIVIVHAYLRREHDAVVLYRRHLMCPSHTYATPPLTEISNCAGSTLSASKPVRLWFQSALSIPHLCYF